MLRLAFTVLTFTHRTPRDTSRRTQAVSENLDLKKAIFRNLSAELSPSAILATNTSSISITKIAATTIPDGQTAASAQGQQSASRVVGELYTPITRLIHRAAGLFDDDLGMHERHGKLCLLCKYSFL